MGVAFTFSQINRLLSRSPMDVLSFTRYFLLGAPSRLIDRFPGKARLAYLPGSKYDVGAKLVELPEEIYSFAHRCSGFGEEIVAKGEISLLGQVMKMGWPPKWETMETGFYPKGASAAIPYYGGDIKSDIKLIWELNRLQWIPPIASFAVRSKDEELCKQIIDSFLDYSEKHPYGRTVAWMEGIEVSLRAISVIISCGLIGNKIDLDQRSRLNYWICLHGDWLSRHLSRKWRLNNNHLILELIGLSIIGMHFDEHTKGKEWLSKSIPLLVKELESQTIDGRNWEPTTAYHRFVTEACLVFLSFARKSEAIDKEVTNIFEEIIGEMVATLVQISDSYGNIPLVGDDDAAIVLPLDGLVNARDCSKVMKFAKNLGFEIDKGPTGAKVWEGNGMGVAWGNGIHAHLVSGSPGGRMRQASHRHLDMLSVCLMIDGKDVLLDCGTGVYFGNDKLRNWFRKEKAHSGIFSDKESWGKIRGQFEITRPSAGTIRKQKNALIAECRLSVFNPIRELEVKDESVIISDFLDLRNPVVNFVFPSDYEISDESGAIKVSNGEFVLSHSPRPISIKVLDVFPQSIIEFEEMENTAISSDGYGIFQECKIIQLFHKRGERTETVISRSHS